MKQILRIAYLVVFLPAVIMTPSQLFEVSTIQQLQKSFGFVHLILAAYWLLVLTGSALIIIAYFGR